MLRSTSILLLLTYLFNSGASSSPSVIIIGAGPAGIAAATRLLENAITNITILEAEDRIGGRIYTDVFGGVLVERGAEYCHGQKGNIVYELASKFNLFSSSYSAAYFANNVYYSNGSIIDPKLIVDLEKFYEEYQSIEDGYNTTGKSIADVFTHRFRSRFLTKYRNDRSKLKILEDTLRLVEFLTLQLEAAFSWLDTSSDSDYENCEGDQNLIWKGVGYKVILDILMKKYPDTGRTLPIDDKIKLNNKVTKIFWKQEDSVVVTTSNRVTYKADYVIFTPSLGVLKEQKNKLFEPKLPLLKQAAIVATGFGGVIKLFMHFPKRWWYNNDYIFTFLYDNEELKNTDFADGPSKNGMSWVTNFVMMSQPYGSSNVWIGWIVGDVVPEVENLPKSILKRGVKHVLDKFLGQRYTVSDIGDIMVSTWWSNENFRGTYSFTKTGLYREDLSYQEVLAQPLGTDDGRLTLLFAGEATNPRHYATVHGAIETGHREADRIVDIHRKKK